MPSRSSTVRIGAIVLAVSLAGSYVWFKAAQAGEGKSRLLPGSKIGRVDLDPARDATPTTTTAPTISPALFYGSKSGRIDVLPTRQPDTVIVEPATAPSTAPAPK